MNYKQIVAIHAPRRYTIDDFKLNNVEEIKELERDFDYYKREFGDKLDDEILVLFDLIENSDLSKKEVKILGMMLKKMYEDKYKKTLEMFHLRAEDVKPEDLKGEFKKVESESDDHEVKIEVIDEVKDSQNIKIIYEKQSEFTEDNYKGFDDIVKIMESSLELEDEDE